MHSYAQALHELTGKWTGPLSKGIEKALLYGAWAGGAPEPDPDRDPEDPVLEPPEIQTYVGIPADLVEAVTVGNVVDGHPEELRQQLNRCRQDAEGEYYINAFIRDLQDQDRLITWSRPARLPGGAPRPNALLKQKYYMMGKPLLFHSLWRQPVCLSQAMGSGEALQQIRAGTDVEALKPGKLLENDAWQPSAWAPAKITAVNYDGTFDLQFKRTWGPFRDNKKYGLKGLPMLSLRKNEIYKGWGADSMSARFRLQQEMEYSPSMPADKIRLPGMLDRLSDIYDVESVQDWYLCTSVDYVLAPQAYSRQKHKLMRYKNRFMLSYKWVPTADGDLRFEPEPNRQMAEALRLSHNDVAQQFAEAANADEEDRKQLKMCKDMMSNFVDKVETPPNIKPDAPSRPAGPIGRGALKEKPKPFKYADYM